MRSIKYIPIMLVALLFAAMAIPSLLSAEEKSGRNPLSQPGIFGPKYIENTNQKTEIIKGQVDLKNSLLEREIETVQNRISNKMYEAAGSKLLPELKKKRSSKEDAAVNSKSVIDSGLANIQIGSGNSKVFDDNNRLVSEVIEGRRYVYAGFDNVGKSNIQEAINMSSVGDTVIVKGGTYSDAIKVKDGVNLYGGYDEKGARDLANTPTVINGRNSLNWVCVTANVSKPTEINGLTINTQGKNYAIVVGGYDLTIRNNTFNVGYGVKINTGSSVYIDNNKFANKGIGVDVQGFIGNTTVKIGTSVRSSNNNYEVSGVKSPSGILVSGKDVYVISTNDYYADNVGRSPGVSVTSLASDPIVETTPSRVTESSVSARPSQYSTIQLKDSRYNSEYYMSEDMLLKEASKGGLYSYAISNIFKTLFKNRLVKNYEQAAMVAGLAKVSISGDSLSDTMLVNKAGIANSEVLETEAALKLAGIIINPNEGQKAMLDAVESLLKDMDSVQEEGGDSETKRAQDELVQVVSTALLAQAIPDLFKEEDISNMKDIFSELNVSKDRIMTNYKESVKPYYEATKELLMKNMASLELNDIIPNLIMKTDIINLEPAVMDEILKGLRNSRNKSFERDYVLQQEEKFRKLYVDPNKKLMEENMKAMMQEFTKRLSGILEEKGVSKK